MPLYYFHVSNENTVLDQDGTEFTDLKAARLEAIRTSGEMLRDIAVHSACALEAPWSLWVTDEPRGNGHTLFRMEFTAK